MGSPNSDMRNNVELMTNLKNIIFYVKETSLHMY